MTIPAIVLDALPPYHALGAMADGEFAAWIAHRIATHAAGHRVQVPGATGLLRSKEADSASLQYPIWEIELVQAHSPEATETLLGALAAAISRPALVTALVPFESAHLLDRLQAHGARVRGANVAWGFAAGDVPPPAPPGGLRTELLREGLQAEFERCLRSSYSTYQSHYHADPRFAAIASDVYVRQVLDDVRDGSEVMVTVDTQDQVLGFSTLDPHRQVNEYLRKPAVAEIGTSGVDATARRGGIYAANASATLSALVARGYSHFVFGTAANNFAIQRTWIRMGLYRPLRFTYRVHWDLR